MRCNKSTTKIWNYTVLNEEFNKTYSLIPLSLLVTRETTLAIDVIVKVTTRGMIYLEKKCRNKREDEIFFSDKLAKANR